MMIKGALEVYAADKIGMVDYALESIGWYESGILIASDYLRLTIAHRFIRNLNLGFRSFE